MHSIILGISIKPLTTVNRKDSCYHCWSLILSPNSIFSFLRFLALEDFQRSVHGPIVKNTQRTHKEPLSITPKGKRIRHVYHAIAEYFNILKYG